MPNLAYAAQTYDSANPLARYAHRSRYQRSRELVRRHLGPRGKLLDYGTGDARLLEMLSSDFSRSQLWGLEPYMEITLPDQVKKTIEELPSPFELITCFEVLEHLGPKEMDEFIAFCKKHLAPGGKILISVPNMIGPAVLLKYINFKLIKRTPWEYSFGEILRAGLLCQSPERDYRVLGAYLGHKGFDWRVLRKVLSGHFDLVEEFHSPFSGLWWGFNSQWFVVLQRR